MVLEERKEQAEEQMAESMKEEGAVGSFKKKTRMLNNVN